MESPPMLQVLALSAALSTGAAAGASDLPGAPGLRLDTGWLAVHTWASATSLGASLRDAGLDASRAEPWPIPGWWLVPLSAGSRGEAAVRAASEILGRGGADVFASPVFRGVSGDLAFPTPTLLVGLEACIEEDGLLAPFGAITDRDWAGMEGVHRVASAARDGFAVLEQARALATMRGVWFAEPDLAFTGRGYTDDPLFDDSWALHNTGQAGGVADLDLDAPQAWSLIGGAPYVHVAVLDVGVQQDHPDLAQVPGADFTGEGGGGGPVSACDNHGTAVAGCISGTADNGIGTAGIAPGCRVASARVFIGLPACDGTWTTQTSWTVDALDWAQANGVRVTCNSNVYSVTSAAVESKYAQTRAAGMVHFAAAGDAGATAVGWPASLADVNAVTAVNRLGMLSAASNSGPGVALSAPGVAIQTTDRTGALGYAAGDFAQVGGSSTAAAFAAGTAALALSRNPTLDAQGVEAVLQQGATDLGAPGQDDSFGAGMVNAYSSARLAAPGGSTERIDVGGIGGAEGNNDSWFPSLSADGRYVAFDSWCSNLVPGDTNQFIDGFVKDRLTGAVSRVTVGPGGVQGNGTAGDVDLSADGRHVAFDGDASNLVVPDTNGASDAFVHDRMTGVTEYASVATDGTQGNGASFIPAISEDGRYVVFRSKATNLVPGDTNASDDVFLRDRVAGVTIRVSVGGAGQQANHWSYEPEISDDGSAVAFMSLATNLAGADSNGCPDIYLRDVVAGTTERVSLSTSGAEPGEESANPALSRDGRLVVFQSKGTNLTPGDTNGVWDVFLRDRAAGTTVRVSVGPGGQQANGASELPWISGDGRCVLFLSDANNLVPGDTNGVRDVYLKDLQTGAVERLSVDSAGAEPQAVFTDGSQVAISHDGRFTAFESVATGLVPGDGNAKYDIFVRDRMTSGGWFDLGQSLGGTSGSPRLTAVGGLEVLGATTFRLTDALPTAPGAHVIGIHELYLPIFGGVLVPSLQLLVPFSTDADGAVEHSQPWPSNVPPGIEVCVQSWVIDMGAVQLVAASNAIAAVAF